VRPRGHLELRVIDAQPGDGWVVPAAVVTALADNPASADAAMAATEPLWGRAARWAAPDLWQRAARLGVADPALATAARGCLEAADAGLARLGTPAERAALTSFAERYTLRGRCPADDVTEAL
jgi:glutamate--cysteine ligase